MSMDRWTCDRTDGPGDGEADSAHRPIKSGAGSAEIWEVAAHTLSGAAVLPTAFRPCEDSQE
jgi:hypothetical protein